MSHPEPPHRPDGPSPPPGHPDTPAEFWGWRMVLAGMAIMVVSSGIGFYGHGVILDPLRSTYNWSKGAVSLAVSLYFFTSGLGQIVIGRQVDRYGPQPVMVVGAIVIGLGFVLLGRIEHLWQLYAVYLIMAIGWCCTGLVPVNTLIANWFIRRRGLAMGVAMTGLSLGGVIIVPLASWIIVRWGLETALPAMGGLYALVVIPVTLLVVKARPSDVDQIPDGRPFPAGKATPGRAGPSMASQTREWTRAQAIRTTAFWAIVIAFLLALCGQMSFLVHQVSFLSQYLGPGGAAGVVSLTALASIAGRLATGIVVDRLNKRMVTAICFLAQGAAVLALAFWHQKAVLYAGTFVFGLAMGNILMLQSLLIGECFGMVSFGTVFGTAGLFSMMGAAFGPWIAGTIFDATGSYRTAFTIFAALSVLAAVSVVFAKPSEPDGTGP